MYEIKRYELKLEELDNIKTGVSRIGSPTDVVAIMTDCSFVTRCEEEIIVLALSTGNEVIGVFQVAKGGVSCCLVYTNSIFRRVLLAGSEKFIVVHNHPFGSLTPSKEDTFITHKISRACKDLDLTMLDHIIVSRNGYYSFKEHNNLYE